MAKTKKRGLFRFIGRWVWRLMLLWIVTTGLLVLSLRWFNPPTSAFMLQRQYSSELEPVSIQYEWREWADITPELALSVIASEDQKFAEHNGFDVEAIKQVLADRHSGKKMRGASTISQQLAKNLFLWSGRSWVRKGLEVYFTGAIELMLSKQRILELYLNVVEFGDGVYGAEAAAQSIFSTSAFALNANQAALLAARLPAPKRYQVNPPSEYMQQRVRWIRQQVKQLGGAAYLRRL